MLCGAQVEGFRGGEENPKRGNDKHSMHKATYVSLKHVWLKWDIVIRFNDCLAHILSYSNSFDIKYSKLINY